MPHNILMCAHFMCFYLMYAWVRAGMGGEGGGGVVLNTAAYYCENKSLHVVAKALKILFLKKR